MKLDQQQHNAVHADENKVIVVAGAGSGKTRVLVERIRWIVTCGANPNSIVAITYTNMAAQEMRERLQDIPGVGDMFIGTIHSFANRILRNSGKQYEIYNQDWENKFMQHLCRKYAKHLTFDRFLQWRDIESKISMGYLDEDVMGEMFSRAELFEVSTLLKRRNIPRNEDHYMQSVHTLAKRNNVITFDELLDLASDYFSSSGAKGVEHLLVDELQDIGYLEYKFIEALGAENSFYVGDDWQAIYAFKGGNVKIFRSLVRPDSEFRRIDLTNNYRSAPAVLGIAEMIIQQCDDIIQKEVNCVNKSDRGQYQVTSKFRLEYLLEKILKEVGTGKCNLNDWFLLVRTNRDLVQISERLAEMEIPFDSFKKSDMSFEEMQDTMQRNTLKLLTVHMAKGLEADNVILYGNFPVQAPTWQDVNKDERRVMYVGITRARKRCWILN